MVRFGLLHHKRPPNVWDRCNTLGHIGGYSLRTTTSANSKAPDASKLANALCNCNTLPGLARYVVHVRSTLLPDLGNEINCRGWLRTGHIDFLKYRIRRIKFITMISINNTRIIDAVFLAPEKRGLS